MMNTGKMVQRRARVALFVAAVSGVVWSGSALAQTGAVNASTPGGISTGPVSDQAAASAQGNTGVVGAAAPPMTAPTPSASTPTRHTARHRRGASTSSPGVAVSNGMGESAAKTMGGDVDPGGPHLR